MEPAKKTTSRKKFLFWSVTALSSFGMFRFLNRKKRTPETVKMLTSDGKLVEVAVSNIPKKTATISDTEIHDWIKPQKA